MMMTPLVLELWGMWSTPSLPLLPLLYTGNNNNNADVSKFNRLLFLFYFIIRNVHMRRVRASEDGRNAHTVASVRFFCETSLPFCFVLSTSKFFPGLYNFLDNDAVLVVTLHAYTPSVTCLLYSIPPSNLRGTSIGSSSCLPEETCAHPVIPPMQPLEHIKGIFLSLPNTRSTLTLSGNTWEGST